MKNPVRPVLVAFMLTLLPLAAWAQAYPAKDLLVTGTTIVGEPIRYPTTGPARVTASVVTITPGADTVFHRHPAPLVAYILAGELTVNYGSHGQRVYRKGDAFVEAMEVTHRGMNLGTETVSILAIYVGAEGTANVALEK